MRGGVRRVALAAVAVALILFAVPLAIVARSLLIDRERAEIELVARTATLSVGPGLSEGDPVELPPVEPGLAVGVYDEVGRLRAGDGPAGPDPAVGAALRGVTGRSDGGSDIVIAVPVISAEKVVAVVRAAESSTEVWRQVASAWAGLCAAAVAALVVAVMVARRQAATLTRPLEILSSTAGQVAEGVLSARAPRSRIPEIDRLGRTQNAMVDGLTAALDRQRNLAADASHQLRTPLAGLQLQLENVLQERPDDIWPILQRALREVQRLQATVEDLLALARLDPSRSTILALREPLNDVVQSVDDRWHGSLAEGGRQLHLSVDRGLQSVLVPSRVVGHVLDAVVENALAHGAGTVSVTVREAVDALAITVADEGELDAAVGDPFERGTTGGSGTGIGLALARTMTEAVGGRLVMVARSPMSIALFLPDETTAP